MQFLNAVKPNEGEKNGHVERWLGEVEEQMHLSLEDLMEKAIADYAKSPRDEW